MKKILLFVICNLGAFILSQAQSPGGVGTTNLRGWYIGQSGITLSGGLVSQWDDNSPMLYHATQTTHARRPSISSSFFNYNQTLYFDGWNDWLSMPDLMPASSTAITVFAVARRAQTPVNSWGCILFGQSNPGGWTGGGFGLTDVSGGNTIHGFWINNWSANQASVNNNLTQISLLTGNWNGTSAGNLQLFLNGALMSSDNYSGTLGDGGSSAIGSSAFDPYTFTGNIAEIVAFNQGLNLTETYRVHSYLAIKYGITLPHAYYNSSGSIVANFTSPHNNKIIGIARDDQSLLLQKQSQTIDDSFRVYIGSIAANNALNTGTFSTNNQYILIGQDQNAVYGQLSDVPMGIYSRLSREFNLHNSNFSDNFNIDIQLPYSVLIDFSLSDLRLLVDNDDNFSNANIFSTVDGITFSLSGNILTISNLNSSIFPMNSSRYFTIASASSSTPLMLSKSPGGISSVGLVAWFNASTGYTLNSGAVQTWLSYSFNDAIAQQSNATFRPVPNPNAMNYNQAFEFDGFNDHLPVSPTILIPPASTHVSAFSVVRQFGVSRDTWGSILLAQTNDSWGGGGYGLTAINASNTNFGFWVHTWSSFYVSQATTLNTPTLLSGSYNGTSPNQLQLFNNGSLITSSNYSGSLGATSYTSIGGSSASQNWCFWGQIPEIIVYNRSLTINEVRRIHSYLGIKYGLTLSHDYINASNQTVYQNMAPYNYRIIGIGRDDLTNLYQKQSHTLDDTFRVFLGTLQTTNAANTSTFSSDNQYVVIGSDGGGLYGQGTEMPSGLFSRLRREWKVTNTNFDGTFNISVRLSNLADPSSVNTADLRLLVDDDGDFSNAIIYSSIHGLTFSYSNPMITVTGINNTMIPMNSTRFITIASVASSTPLPTPNFTYNAFLNKDNQVVNTWKLNSLQNQPIAFKIINSKDLLDWNEKITIDYIQGQDLYQWTDTNPLSGISYYRLVFIYPDGKIEYSEPVEIFVQKEFVQIYPNPTNNHFQILTNIEDYSAELVSLEGKTITIWNNPQKEYHLDNLTDGIYSIKFINKKTDNISYHKLIVYH